MRAGWALAAAAACWLWAQPGFGQADANRLLAVEPLPDGVADRIAGQIADLAWSIDRAAEDARGVPAATRLATEHHARAVLWVAEDADGFVLRLFDVRKRRVLERRFARQGGGALSRSAALESLALAVRSSLRALAAEEDVGQAVEEDATIGAGVGGSGSGGEGGNGQGQGQGQGKIDDEHEHEHEHERRVDEGGEEAEEEYGGDVAAALGPGLSAEATALILAGGWGGALDGESPLQHGPWARVGVGFGRVEVAVTGELAMGADIRDDDEATTLHVRRSDAFASAGFAMLQAARAHVAVALDVGLASFARETRMVGPGLAKTEDDALQSLALGVELRGAVQLVSSRTFALELELSAGLLALPAAPVLQYEGASGRVEHALWLVQPQLRLGPRIRLGL